MGNWVLYLYDIRYLMGVHLFAKRALASQKGIVTIMARIIVIAAILVPVMVQVAHAQLSLIHI